MIEFPFEACNLRFRVLGRKNFCRRIIGEYLQVIVSFRQYLGPCTTAITSECPVLILVGINEPFFIFFKTIETADNLVDDDEI